MKAAVPQIAPVPFLLLPLLAATARDGTGPQYFDTRTCGPTLQDLNPAGREVHPKWAFVFAHDLHVEPNASELSQAFHLLRHFHPQPQGPQIVFLHPQPDATGSPQLTPLLREALQRHSVRPIAKTMPQVSESLRRWGDSRKNCCSWREYFKLTAWTLVEFEAVILLDSDQLAIGDLSSAFLCAQGGAGRLLYTSGPLSPLNAGFLALRTSYQLFQDMERVISQVNFHPRRGFDSLGFGARGWFRDNPPKQPPAAANKAHYGAEGPQGFLYYYFVQRRRRSAALGVPRQLKGSDGLEVEALELDRCVWNYQKEGLARGAGGNPCRNYAEGPLLVHKQDSYARWFVAEALRRSNALEL